MESFEAEIYRGVFDARKERIQKILDYYYSQHLNFGTIFNTLIETDGNRQVWLSRTTDDDGNESVRYYGFVELTELRLTTDTPVEVRVVCCFKPLVIFWEEVAHLLRLNYWMGYLKEDAPIFPGFGLKLSTVLETDSALLQDGQLPRDSGHYNYSPEKRKEIADEYRRVRDKGEINNKELWASMHYHITARTLLNYEKEFPPET